MNDKTTDPQGSSGLQGQSAAGCYAIRQTGDRIVLSAGVLEKTLEVAGGKLTGKGLAVDGAPLLAADSDEVSLRIARAEPDRNPLEVTTAVGHAIHVKEAEAGGTDALAVDAREDARDSQPVAWEDERSLAGKTWNGCFNLSNAAICSPAPGVSRLIVRVRSVDDNGRR